MNTHSRYAKGPFVFVCMVVLLAVLSPLAGKAQGCTEQIRGIIRDKDGAAIPGVSVMLSAKDTLSATSDVDGIFRFRDLCPGNYTLFLSEVGYAGVQRRLSLPGADSIANITLAEGTEQLREVLVTGQKRQEIATIAHVELAGNSLLEVRGKSLAESIKQLAGVNAIQSGPTLSKPVVHGLSGNRVLLVNNGVRQEGQQWGNDHAPEIDPFTADKITVLKGAASIRYGADAIAGVILLDPAPLPEQKTIGGSISAVASSNGQMGTISGMLQGAFDKKLSGLSWRVQGTLQRSGNFRTANYYLFNTGMAEEDFSAQLGYKWKFLNLSASYSQYNAKLGIFRGSDVGNKEDLLAAFARAKPITPDEFSYKIDRSYQSIRHQVFRAAAEHVFANHGSLSLSYARQQDVRSEYDIDLPYTSDSSLLFKPQVQFKIVTHTLDLAYKQPSVNGFSGIFGISGSTQGNVYSGLRYLIPNFRNYGAGAFAIERYETGKWMFEAGLRYDYRWLQVYQRNPTSLELYDNTYNYNSVTGTAGVTYNFNDHLSLNANFGTGWRPPSINEMYIQGIHLSAARFEIGDSLLKSERSYNTTLSLNYHTDKLKAQVDLYDNEINNFIYARYIGVVVNSKGANPGYQYTQTNASLLGADITLQWDPIKQLTLFSKTSLLRATNKSEHDGLVYMPPSRFLNGITYHLPQILRLDNAYVTLENISVLGQRYVNPDADAIPPPPGYSIWNARMGCAMPLGKKTLDLNFSVDNLTNLAYRDYLNLFRYYADDLGINFTLRAKLSF
ncbi:TonB-dependent receptor [Taibaiella koreensis]|uniref:TonB-dependent receptor n=1 Tax=Taibaiella koreensis TaxID=1268548 RepID=UPI000E59BE90|nr:TonB-dependent receptor [Taibaiella koreensis]